MNLVAWDKRISQLEAELGRAHGHLARQANPQRKIVKLVQDNARLESELRRISTLLVEMNPLGSSFSALDQATVHFASEHAGEVLKQFEQASNISLAYLWILLLYSHVIGEKPPGNWQENCRHIANIYNTLDKCLKEYERDYSGLDRTLVGLYQEFIAIQVEYANRSAVGCFTHRNDLPVSLPFNFVPREA